MDDTQILQQAITAIKKGDRAIGQKLLLSLVRANPNNETAWLWLSITTDDITKKRQCLDRVLVINPNNETAKRGLTELQKQVSQPKQVEIPKIETPSQQVETTSELPPKKPVSPKPLEVVKQEATKKCPYCAETIKVEAKFCQFCGKDLTEKQNIEQSVRTSLPPQPVKKKGRTGNFLLAIIVSFIIVCCGLYLMVNLFRVPGGSSTKSEPGNILSTPTVPLEVTPIIFDFSKTPTPVKKTISLDEQIEMRTACQTFVERRLKSPSTADFLLETEKVFGVTGKPDNYFIVKGQVDAQNSYGATIRSSYACQVYYDESKQDWVLDELVIEP